MQHRLDSLTLAQPLRRRVALLLNAAVKVGAEDAWAVIHCALAAASALDLSAFRQVGRHLQLVADLRDRLFGIPISSFILLVASTAAAGAAVAAAAAAASSSSCASFIFLSGIERVGQHAHHRLHLGVDVLHQPVARSALRQR